MVIRYRDTDGRFISRRAASHITTRQIDSEAYDDRGKRALISPGYSLDEKALGATIAAQAVALGVNPDFAADAVRESPFLNAQDIAAEYFEGLPLEEFMDFDLDADFSTDEETYFG